MPRFADRCSSGEFSIRVLPNVTVLRTRVLHVPSARHTISEFIVSSPSLQTVGMTSQPEPLSSCFPSLALLRRGPSRKTARCLGYFAGSCSWVWIRIRCVRWVLRNSTFARKHLQKDPYSVTFTDSSANCNWLDIRKPARQSEWSHAFDLSSNVECEVG